MSNQFETDVIIIGAGPVGLFAVFQCGMLGMKCHVVDALEHIGGQCQALYPEKPIYDIPAYPKIKASDLIANLEKQILPFSPKFYLNQKTTSIQKLDDIFEITTSTNIKIRAKAVIIAAGAGAFGPNRPPLKNIEQYEGKSIFYMVKNKNDFCNKKIAIAGGGDSAVDWALALSEVASKIYVIHRRNKFRASDEMVKRMHYFADNYGVIDIKVPYQLDSVHGSNGILKSIDIVDFDGNKEKLEIDSLLPFFGLASDLSFMKNWGIDIDKNHIIVDSSTTETNLKGVFAIGDIATYKNKLKLILTGFAEAALAAHMIYPIVFSGKELHFEYSTTKGIS